MTQKVRWSGILPANSCRILKNLDVHDTNGYLQKAWESSRNRNTVYRLQVGKTREETSLQRAGKERNGEHDKENDTVETAV